MNINGRKRPVSNRGHVQNAVQQKGSRMVINGLKLLALRRSTVLCVEKKRGRLWRIPGKKQLARKQKPAKYADMLMENR